MEHAWLNWWPVVIAVFGAGLGWGVHQVTLSLLSKAVIKLEVKVERLDNELNHLNENLTRIESKLDMLLRACPAMTSRTLSCGD